MPLIIYKTLDLFLAAMLILVLQLKISKVAHESTGSWCGVH